MYLKTISGKVTVNGGAQYAHAISRDIDGYWRIRRRRVHKPLGIDGTIS